jgi:hypothetical protein
MKKSVKVRASPPRGNSAHMRLATRDRKPNNANWMDDPEMHENPEMPHGADLFGTASSVLKGNSDGY